MITDDKAIPTENPVGMAYSLSKKSPFMVAFLHEMWYNRSKK